MQVSAASGISDGSVLDSGFVHGLEAVLRDGVLPPWPSLINTRTH